MSGYSRRVKAIDGNSGVILPPCKIGDWITTLKGDKQTGHKAVGWVYGFSKWRHYPSALIEQDDGFKTSILLKNVVLLEGKP